MKIALPLLSSATLLLECATAPSLPRPVTTTPAPAPVPAPAAQARAPIVKAVAVDDVQVGRYTTLARVPSEADAEPLAVVAKVHFPRPGVNTVGDAVRHLLLRTGYRLADGDRLDEGVRLLLSLSLPDNHRVLGPYRVDAMLGALVGRSFRLVADPTSRVVTYVTAAGNPGTVNDTRAAPSLAKAASTASAAPAVPASQQRGPR